MKLAIINYKKEASMRAYSRLRQRGVEIVHQKSLADFLEKHKSFEGFDGVILHPATWRETIQIMNERFPETHYILATFNIGEQVKSIEGVRIFDFMDTNGMINYFKSLNQN
jgi:hypothetical protein